jgi:hypothetical protein
MKQTAVEWFAEKIGHNSLMGLIEYNELFEQAKEMEKEQIENAFNYGQCDLGMEADEYYNEIYKSE